jgi:hypothetical protein
MNNKIGKKTNGCVNGAAMTVSTTAWTRNRPSVQDWIGGSKEIQSPSNPVDALTATTASMSTNINAAVITPYKHPLVGDMSHLL